MGVINFNKEYYIQSASRRWLQGACNTLSNNKKRRSNYKAIPDELEQRMNNLQRDIEDIKERLREGCIMHYFYFGSLAAGFSASLIYELFIRGAPDLSTIFLYALSFCLWLRFWLYDTRNPGYKCTPLVKERIREGIFYSLALLLSFFLITVFLFVGQPLFYMCSLAIVYGIKGAWHYYHQRNFEENSVESNILRLASFSDVIIAFILGIYSIIFLGDLYIFRLLGIPSFLHVDAGSYLFRICIALFVIGTTAGLEFHYYAVEKMLNNLLEIEQEAEHQ
jgi:hypothetical protein